MSNSKGYISAVILTFNEERNIQRCLNSLEGVADEIIVIDSFSTDSTEQICKRHSVQFIQRKWEGYSAAKNYGNSIATYDYVLSLDADEALSSQLQKSILAVKDEFDNTAFSMHRLTNYCGHWIHHSGWWYPDTKIRLWNKNKGQWAGAIHEELNLSCKVTLLQGDILHYSYYSLNDHLTRIDKYTDLMAKSRFENGKRSNLFRVLISPFFKFVKSYFFQLGFLDGYYGFIVCTISSYVTFLKYIKMKELQKQPLVFKTKKNLLPVQYESLVFKHN